MADTGTDVRPFCKAKSTINEHIQNVYAEGELIQDSTMKKFGNSEFSKKPTNYYNLDVIISVGYRVKSQQGTQFRIWATQRLRDYIIKGFALNDERFKSGSSMNYFRELLERIRTIRIEEKVFYQQIKDIYRLSKDYDPDAQITLDFSKSPEQASLGCKRSDSRPVSLFPCKPLPAGHGTYLYV